MTAKTDTAKTVTVENSPKRYQVALSTARKALATTGQSSWTVGDMALRVASVYGDGTVKRFASDLDLSAGTVYDFRSTSQAYPDGTRGVASWTVHQILRDQPDRHELVKQTMTAASARDLVKTRKMDAGEIETDELKIAEAKLAKAEAEVKRLRIKIDEIKAARKGTKPAKADAPEADAPKADAPKPAADKCSCGKTHRAGSAAAVRCAETRAAAAKVTRPAPAAGQHIVKGVPAHTAADNRADCPKCRPAQHTPTARKARNRTARASQLANA